MRKDELLKQFDELVSELVFLMVPTEQLVDRLNEIKRAGKGGTTE